jgi:hypothetical protein
MLCWLRARPSVAVGIVVAAAAAVGTAVAVTKGRLVVVVENSDRTMEGGVRTGSCVVVVVVTTTASRLVVVFFLLVRHHHHNNRGIQQQTRTNKNNRANPKSKCAVAATATVAAAAVSQVTLNNDHGYFSGPKTEPSKRSTMNQPRLLDYIYIYINVGNGRLNSGRLTHCSGRSIYIFGELERIVYIQQNDPCIYKLPPQLTGIVLLIPLLAQQWTHTQESHTHTHKNMVVWWVYICR